ncbi:MAG: hypothetical protein WCK78_19780 [Paludibacter sp.]
MKRVNKVFELLKKNWFFVVFILLFIIVYYTLNKNDSDYNEYRCETVKLELKGIITYKSGHGEYGGISVNNYKKGISFDLEKCIYKIGFDENRSYQVGDSVIKKAGSKEVTIKKDNCIAVYTLKCDD